MGSLVCMKRSATHESQDLATEEVQTQATHNQSRALNWAMQPILGGWGQIGDIPGITLEGRLIPVGRGCPVVLALLTQN